jgi:hypothetical protein
LQLHCLLQRLRVRLHLPTPPVPPRAQPQALEAAAKAVGALRDASAYRWVDLGGIFKAMGKARGGGGGGAAGRAAARAAAAAGGAAAPGSARR